MRFDGTYFTQAILPKGVPRLLFCLALTVGLSGCTRPSNSSANIQISFGQSSNGSLAAGTSVLKHAIIQVTGSGVTPAICFYDSDPGSGNNAIPACSVTADPNTTGQPAFTLDVQQGSALTIQAIAVYSDANDGGMTFYYGDIQSAVNQPSVTVPVTVAPIATQAVAGRVIGRYLTSSDAGPTGALNIFYIPANGSPRLLVDSSPIINGWMNALALSGVPLLYVVNDSTPPTISPTTTTSTTTTTTTGVTTTSTTIVTTTTTTLPSGAVSGETVLWGGPVSLDMALFSGSTYVTRASLPPSLRKTTDSSGNSVIESVDPTIYVWGYFGTTAAYYSSKTTCVDTATSFQNLKVYSASPTQAIYSTSAYMTPTTATAPTTAALITTSTPLTSVYFNGGMASTTTPCTSATAATLFLDVYKVGVSLVDGNGNDGAGGFRVPFTTTSLMNMAATVTVGGTPPVVISGQLLPGVQAAGTVVTAFKGISSASYYNSFDCTQMPAGFTAAGSGALDSNGNFSINTSVTAAEVAAGATAVILCPANFPRAGQFLNSALIHSGTPQPATHFTVNIDSSIIGTNQCHAMFINLLSASNGAGYSTTSQTFAISLSNFGAPSAFQFYSDSGCTSPLSNQAMYTMPALSLGATLYVMGTNVETGSPSVMFNDSPLGAAQTVTLQVRAASVATKFSSPHLTMTAGQCQDVTVFTLDSVGTTAPPSATTTVNIAVGSNGVHVVASCANQSGTVSNTISPSSYSISFGVVANANVSAGDYMNVTDTSPGSLQAGAVVVNTNVVNSMIMRASSGGTVGVTGSFVSGICEQMIIQRVDGSNNPVTTEGALPFSASITSSSGAKLYSDSACSGSGSTTLTGTFAAGVGSMPIYMKESATLFSTSDNIYFSLSVTGANGSSTSNTMYKPNLIVSPTSLSGTCTAVTVSLARQGDSAAVSGVTNGVVTNASVGTLGVYGNMTDCMGSTNSLTTYNFGTTVYMKNLSGTSGSANLMLQSSSNPDIDIIGSTALTAALPLTP